MLSHLGLNVRDLAVAKRYYDQIMPGLGYEGFLASDAECGYRPESGRPAGYLFLYQADEGADYSRDAVGLQHLAFAVRTRSEVDAVHAVAVRLASTVLDGPQIWPLYGPSYYATFWLDPSGFKLEAVCTSDVG